jgi:hypothetical protein
VFVAARALRADHDWRRREVALQLIGSWNENTSRQIAEIKKLLPHMRDQDEVAGRVADMTRKQAEDVYQAVHEGEHWETKLSLIQLLNYYENIAIAYEYKVADEEILRSSVRAPIARLLQGPTQLHRCE